MYSSRLNGWGALLQKRMNTQSMDSSRLNGWGALLQCTTAGVCSTNALQWGLGSQLQWECVRRGWSSRKLPAAGVFQQLRNTYPVRKSIPKKSLKNSKRSTTAVALRILAGKFWFADFGCTMYCSSPPMDQQHHGQNDLNCSAQLMCNICSSNLPII